VPVFMEISSRHIPYASCTAHPRRRKGSKRFGMFSLAIARPVLRLATVSALPPAASGGFDQHSAVRKDNWGNDPKSRRSAPAGARLLRAPGQCPPTCTIARSLSRTHLGSMQSAHTEAPNTVIGLPDGGPLRTMYSFHIAAAAHRDANHRPLVGRWAKSRPTYFHASEQSRIAGLAMPPLVSPVRWLELRSGIWILSSSCGAMRSWWSEIASSPQRVAPRLRRTEFVTTCNRVSVGCWSARNGQMPAATEPT
jgi:hypothetical protein